MPKTLIVSASNADYFPLLTGMLSSVLNHARRDGFDIGIFDVGLTPHQRIALEQKQILLVKPDWSYDVQLFATAPPDFFKALTARPHLARYFPGYDIYVWLDADCWVQDWNTIRLYVECASALGFVVTPECDRSYAPHYSSNSVLEYAYRCFRQCVDDSQSQWLSHFPMINAGVFAARADAPHFPAWSRVLGDAMRGRSVHDFFLEQTSLNIVIRTLGLSTAMLPARHNWMCNRALPFSSADGNLFLEAQAPFEPLGILHLTGNTKDRDWPIHTLSGQTQRRSLRFGGPNLFQEAG